LERPIDVLRLGTCHFTDKMRKGYILVCLRGLKPAEVMRDVKKAERYCRELLFFISFLKNYVRFRYIILYMLFL